MRFVAAVLNFTGKVFIKIGHFFVRIGYVFHGLLPVALGGSQLSGLLNQYYANGYYEKQSLEDDASLVSSGFDLEAWEADVCARYGIDSGKMLVLGCGYGREAIEIAKKMNVEVIGLDRHLGALRAARRIADKKNVPAHFLQGDFLTLPYNSKMFDFAMLSSTMYSAIPGLARRQAWLQDLGGLLRKDGLVILSFQIDRRDDVGLIRLTTWFRALLRMLPGSNPAYQIGDVCQGGHFFHLFQDEDELRVELESARVVVRELNWPEQYAVLSYPGRA